MSHSIFNTQKTYKSSEIAKKGDLSYQSEIAKKVGLTEKTVRELLKKYDREGLSRNNNN